MENVFSFLEVFLFSNLTSNALGFWILTLVSTLSAVFMLHFIRMMSKGLKFSLRIAVIGLPRSGKTTLITVVFDAIMSGKLAKYMSVSGLETIDRLTLYLNKIHNSLNLGPTTDADVFAYRYIVDRVILGIVPSKYDVEIADFPGEYSEKLSSSMSEQILHAGVFDKQFFSWIIRADKYVFVIDAQEYLRSLANKTYDNPSYVSVVELAFKNAVFQLKQELLDERVYDRPILLVFTKCDSFLIEENEINVGELDLRYHDPRFEELLDNHAVAIRVDERIDKMFEDFDNLFMFLKNNFKNMEIVVHSSYWEKGRFAEGSQKVVEFASP